MKKFISTTLPYPNSRPHIGHAFEFIIADIITRYYRNKLGTENIIFNVGIDEHGLKIQKAAEVSGLDTQTFCDMFAGHWKSFCNEFQISYNNFYRTSDLKHIKSVQNIFQKFLIKFCKKDFYQGKYCVGCESFITEKEILNNQCPIHNIELEEISEESWFFDLAYFRKNIKNILVDKTLSKELNAQSKDFNKISISRKNVKWGIKIDENLTLYVWADALLNYCLAAGFLTDTTNIWKQYWENSLIICGPDNLKFQAYILQAINHALRIPQNKEVLVHSVILDKEGKKMSKTVGNVVDPTELAEKYGISPVRFYLGVCLNTTGQANFNEIDLVNNWNAQIVDGLGNCIARVLHLIDIKKIKIVEQELTSTELLFQKALESYNLKKLNDLLFDTVNFCNKKINEEKPFSKDCLNPEKILNELYHTLKLVSKYYSFIIPEYEERLKNAFIINKKIVLFQKLNYEK